MVSWWVGLMLSAVAGGEGEKPPAFGRPLKNLLEEPVWLLEEEEEEVEQAGNPADRQRAPEQDPTQPRRKMVEREQEVIIKAQVYSEEDRVGPYKQPEWTQHRRWPTTRVYLQQPPGGVEFEQWLEIRVPKEGGKRNEVRLRHELEFGLGSRLQLDLYAHTRWTRHRSGDASSDNSLEWRGWSAELRWALADWDEIFGNPTIYFEYILFNGAEETIEPKLLLGGEIAPGWHWGTNLVYERELAGFRDRTEEFKITAGVSRTLIDKYLSLGAALETAYVVEREDSTRAERAREVHIGPSLQFRPIPKAHIDLEPLWGVTGESKRLKMFIVFGWDF
jgi:hypothetical protein